MSGKAQLIFVIAFGIVLSAIAFRMNKSSKLAVHNSANYYELVTSHHLALAGTHAGIVRVYQDSGWYGTIAQEVQQGSRVGTFTVIRTPADPLVLTSISSFLPVGLADSLHDTVEVYFESPLFRSFSLFSWMTNREDNVEWVTGDSVIGRLHTNGVIKVYGSPVFMDKVSATNGFNPPPGTWPNKGRYNKGWEIGADSIFFPMDLDDIVEEARDTTTGGRYFDRPDLWVTLDPGTSASGDGIALVRESAAGPVIDSVRLAAGFNGVIMGSGNVHVQGIVDGQINVSAMTNIYIEDDVVYEQDPRTYGSSNDIIGLVSDQNIIVADNAANGSNCNIQAALFCRTGSLTVENYNNGVTRGYLRVLGSIVQDARGPVGTNSNGVINSGYAKRYRFDDRFFNPDVRPPMYPGYVPRTLPVVGWWESFRLPDFRQYGIYE